ncbi:energy transducer TonB [Sphingomonas sp. G-3-2-10]|uniref:energy transducer TonB n=1 Tax=Sphingomonas sp. G-3-2-10 TaxID=2728838 RepID=UPI00146E5D10|nr:energy transducer TonB [Sphingomonas sp. G-3-2-10]NML08217.1 TonB family protein [Sphingomonas sp. G-3-2-10]
MYANRSSLPFGINPAGLGFAMVVNGAIIGAMVFLIAPNIIGMKPPTVLIGEQIPIDEPPPPEKPQPKPESHERVRETLIYQPPVEHPVVSENPVTTTTERPAEPALPALGEPKGTADVIPDPPKPIPPLIAAQPDPRYASQFQPEYPGQEIRMNRDGTVSVRVLIGTDGRVKAVEQIRATSTAFYEATRRHALAKWRFKPATRGGEPQESWKTMNVRFEMTGQ